MQTRLKRSAVALSVVTSFVRCDCCDFERMAASAFVRWPKGSTCSSLLTVPRTLLLERLRLSSLISRFCWSRRPSRGTSCGTALNAASITGTAAAHPLKPTCSFQADATGLPSAVTASLSVFTAAWAAE